MMNRLPKLSDLPLATLREHLAELSRMSPTPRESIGAYLAAIQVAERRERSGQAQREKRPDAA